MKLATAGCPRNCSEATIKDVGAVAIEGGRWEIYVGGAAGAQVRKGDLLVHRRHARGGAAATWAASCSTTAKHAQVPRAHLRLRRADRHRARSRACSSTTPRASARALDADMQAAVDAYVDPWQEARRSRCIRSQFTTLPSATADGGAHRMSRAPPPASASVRFDRIPLGEARVFRVDGREVAVFRCRSGEVFATSAECPHRGGPLADGLVGGHRSSVRSTGSVRPAHRRAPGRDCDRLTTHRVTVGDKRRDLTLELA